ncbi:unnamed protein product [Rotaria sp. Silwood1]|nr:unnamed protein product [Rotaria sp. Silwood1]
MDIHENLNDDNLIYSTFRLFGSQNVYVELLWKYIMYQYNYSETVIHFAGLVKSMLDSIRQATSVYISIDIHHEFRDEAIEKTKETLILSQNEPVSL